MQRGKEFSLKIEDDDDVVGPHSSALVPGTASMITDLLTSFSDNGKLRSHYS